MIGLEVVTGATIIITDTKLVPMLLALLKGAAAIVFLN
jgi:hypothetical protein